MDSALLMMCLDGESQKVGKGSEDVHETDVKADAGKVSGGA
jgi:hypothetical protein